MKLKLSFKRKMAVFMAVLMTFSIIIGGQTLIPANAEQGNDTGYEIAFSDVTVNGNTITYAVGEANVTVTVENGTVSDSKVIIPDGQEETVTFALSNNFDPDTMEVALVADDGFAVILNVNNGSTSLANKTTEGVIPNKVKLVVRAKGNNNPGPEPGNDSGYEIAFTDGTVNGNTITYAVGEANVTVTVENETVSDSKVIIPHGQEETVTFALSDSFDPDTMEVVLCVADVNDDFEVTLNVSEGRTSLKNRENDGPIPGNLKLIIRAKGNNGPGGGPEGPENNFDGRAYFVWQGKDDTLCVHEITGLEESRSQGDIIAFDIIYIPVSDVKDDDTGEQFVIGNENYFWMWSAAEQFIEDNNSSYTAFANALDNIWGTPEFRSIAIDPCGAEDGNSTVCTNGDRNFRATIYDDTTFEGVAFSQNENDYTYFPSFWDNVFFTNTVDISNSTAEEPAVYEAFLIEPTIHFGKADNSVNEFTGIRALNVPDGAVTITENPAGGYDIEFGSNFFDNVVFEITTANENYYIEIARTAIQVFDTNGPEEENPQVVAKIFYDKDESYTDYEVYATIHYKDGSISVQKTTVSEITDDGLGNTPAPGTYEMEAGKGLKCAQYSVPLTDDIEGIDFNAVKSGALSGDSYGGSYFGSENGVYYDVEERCIVY